MLDLRILITEAPNVSPVPTEKIMTFKYYISCFFSHANFLNQGNMYVLFSISSFIRALKLGGHKDH